jgi:uncharacterized protein
MTVGPTLQGTARPAHEASPAQKSYTFSTPAILSFFALALSWSWCIGLGAQYVLPHSPALGTSLAMVSGFGPSLAGIAVVALFGTRAGFRNWIARCVNWRAGWHWYAVAFFLPPAIMLVALILHGALGGTVPASPAINHIPMAIANFALVLVVGGPLGEEFGWRGYALPAMTARFNWRIASLLVGFAWGLWHLPLFFMANTLQSHLPFHMFLISTMAESVMFAWLYRNTRGSVIPALVMHTSINAWMNIIPVLPGNGGLQPLAMMAGIQTIVAVVLLWGAEPTFERRPIITRPPC